MFLWLLGKGGGSGFLLFLGIWDRFWEFCGCSNSGEGNREVDGIDILLNF